MKELTNTSNTLKSFDKQIKLTLRDQEVVKAIRGYTVYTSANYETGGVDGIWPKIDILKEVYSPSNGLILLNLGTNNRLDGISYYCLHCRKILNITYIRGGFVRTDSCVISRHQKTKIHKHALRIDNKDNKIENLHWKQKNNHLYNLVLLLTDTNVSLDLLESQLVEKRFKELEMTGQEIVEHIKLQRYASLETILATSRGTASSLAIGYWNNETKHYLAATFLNDNEPIPFTLKEFDHINEDIVKNFIQDAVDQLKAKSIKIVSFTINNNRLLRSSLNLINGAIGIPCLSDALLASLSDAIDINELRASYDQLKDFQIDTISWNKLRWTTLGRILEKLFNDSKYANSRFPELLPIHKRIRAVRHALYYIQNDNITLQETFWILMKFLKFLWNNEMRDLYGAIMWRYFKQISPEYLYETIVYFSPALARTEEMFKDPHFDQAAIKSRFETMLMTIDKIEKDTTDRLFDTYSEFLSSELTSFKNLDEVLSYNAQQYRDKNLLDIDFFIPSRFYNFSLRMRASEYSCERLFSSFTERLIENISDFDLDLFLGLSHFKETEGNYRSPLLARINVPVEGDLDFSSPIENLSKNTSEVTKKAEKLHLKFRNDESKVSELICLGDQLTESQNICNSVQRHEYFKVANIMGECRNIDDTYSQNDLSCILKLHDFIQNHFRL